MALGDMIVSSDIDSSILSSSVTATSFCAVVALIETQSYVATLNYNSHLFHTFLFYEAGLVPWLA